MYTEADSATRWAAPTVAFTVLAQLCGSKANETEMGATLFTKCCVREGTLTLTLYPILLLQCSITQPTHCTTRRPQAEFCQQVLILRPENAKFLQCCTGMAYMLKKIPNSYIRCELHMKIWKILRIFSSMCYCLNVCCLIFISPVQRNWLKLFHKTTRF